MFKSIPLGNGKSCKVDASDYEHLGKFNWYLDKAGSKEYAARAGAGRPVRMHRQIASPGPGLEVDHKNGDTLDNRRCNLRVCTRTQNNGNRKKSKRGSSRYKGVWWECGNQRWCAALGIRQQRIWCGRHKDEKDAAIAYDRAAKEYFGEFARLNFPDSAGAGRVNAGM